jgi:hypothetical protein
MVLRSAADILAGNLMTTKRIYNFFMEQVLFTNNLEIKCYAQIYPSHKFGKT